MNDSPNIILAIAPGKRELGIAAFAGVDLVYVSVKTITHGKSRKSMQKEITDILHKLFAGFPIKTVVIKAISQYQKQSPDLERIVERVRLESEKKSVPVEEVTLEQIKFVLCQNERTTEKKAFEAIVNSYPELARYWDRPNKWQNDYYAFLFSAVAVGAVYLKTLSETD